MKQSSIEWLYSEMNRIRVEDECENIGAVEFFELQRNALEQAKAMHKEEIMDAHIEGQRVFDKFPHTQWTNDQAEQYYNQTFNTKEK